jgi:RND superfamily putative drug exporter
VFGPAEPLQWNSEADLALLQVPLTVDSSSKQAFAAVDLLRDTLVPEAFSGTSAEVLVSGAPAFSADFETVISDYTPIVFAFVLGLSFILLMLAFRSIVVPLKAIVMNLLSVGAAYGLLVLVFQKGYMHEFLGFQQTPTIENWIPIFLFCVLFGLSMDYHVFLLSRIREHYDLTHNNRESVAVGLQSTGRIITGAALIMVAVFTGFASGQLVMFQQMGFGLAIAVLLDATIVRSILVPASMALLGDRNWYMPKWLTWLPDLRVEGTATPVAVPDVSPAD